MRPLYYEQGPGDWVIAAPEGLNGYVGLAIEETVDTLLRQGCRRVAVSLAETDYVEYEGLEALAATAEAVHRAGVAFTVDRIPPDAERLLAATRSLAVLNTLREAAA